MFGGSIHTHTHITYNNVGLGRGVVGAVRADAPIRRVVFLLPFVILSALCGGSLLLFSDCRVTRARYISKKHTFGTKFCTRAYTLAFHQTVSADGCVCYCVRVCFMHNINRMYTSTRK